MLTVIKNTKIIKEDSLVWDGIVAFNNGIIKYCDEATGYTIPENATVIDAKGLYTAPGFVDLHCHGCGDYYFYENPLECLKHFIKHGETTITPTFYDDVPMDKLIPGAKNIIEASKTELGQVFDGIYFEGPYMRGTEVWTGKPKYEDYSKIYEAFGDYVRVWAIDPSREGIEEFMAYIKSKNPNAIFSLGHSTATTPECRKLKKYGIKNQTHHQDGGKAPGNAQGTIGAGCDEFTLYDSDIYAELICDQNAVHIAPDLIKLIIKTKGVDRINLISDSMPNVGDYLNDESKGVKYGPDLCYDSEGLLFGSHLTLDAAVRNVMKNTGYGLCHAVKFASINPARMLGIDDKVGSIEIGKKANLIIMDDSVNISKVFLNGKEM